MVKDYRHSFFLLSIVFSSERLVLLNAVAYVSQTFQDSAASLCNSSAKLLM